MDVDLRCAVVLLSALVPGCLVQRPPALATPPTWAHETRRSFHPGGEVVRREFQVRIWSDGRVERDGFEREFFASGAREAERFFSRGQPTGSWRTWYESGAPRSEVEFGDDAHETPMRFWHVNGRLAAEGSGIAGVREGPWTFWTESGEIAREGSYRRGLRQGPWTFRDEHGAKRAEGRYEAGQRVGPWTLWDLAGEPHEKRGDELAVEELEPAAGEAQAPDQ